MSSDQGAQRVPWFFITKEYWGYRDKREFLEGDTLARRAPPALRPSCPCLGQAFVLGLPL